MTAIGIDLGTTNTAAARKLGELPEVVDFEGEHTMRSAVTFAEGDDRVIVGNEAVDYLETDPDLTITSVKRQMGTDTTFSIDDDSYTLTEYTPEMISGLVLQKVVQAATDSLGTEPESAVVTVPADFPEPARRATERAAEYAGIDVLRLLPEPSAACAAYGLRDRGDPFETVAVYDLGGGTFDISVVEITHEADLYEVQGTDGRQKLGGDDFDDRLLDHVADEFKAETGIDVRETHEQYERLRRKVKKAKHKLSKATETEIRVPFIAPGENLEQTVTRETFEELTSDLVDETVEVCGDLFAELDGIDIDDVDTVLLVGGSSKMPQVQAAVEEFFGMKPSKEVNPDEAVAEGAAKQASIIASRSGIGPDGADPSGGAIFDVSPDPIGIRLHDGSFDVIIENNATLPVKHTQDQYTTVEDGQERARIEVYKGESERATDNELIESFILDEIREAKAGVPNLAVELELDESGILRPQAWDKSIGDEASIDGGVEISPEGEEGEPETDEEVERVRDELPKVN